MMAFHPHPHSHSHRDAQHERLFSPHHRLHPQPTYPAPLAMSKSSDHIHQPIQLQPRTSTSSSTFSSDMPNSARGSGAAHSSSPASEGDEGEDGATPSGKGPKQRKPRVVERGREACNECRHHKIRCHPTPNDPTHMHPCARCARMSLECVFKKHNRGRKRKQPISDEPTDQPSASVDYRTAPRKPPPPPLASSSVDRVTSGSPATAETIRLPPLFSKPGADGKPTLLPPSSSIFGSRITSRYPFIALGNPSASASSDDASPSRAGHSVPRPEPRTMSLWSMVQAESDVEEQDVGEEDELDDDDEEGDDVPVKDDFQPVATSTSRATATDRSAVADVPKFSRPMSGSSGRVEDPVSAGILAESEAVGLFSLFVRKFNHAMPVIDPLLHDYEHVRRNSPFLYTAIMTVASRYLSTLPPTNTLKRSGTPPDSLNSAHKRILALARDHLTLAFVDAISEISVVKAIAILTMWKEPDDDKTAFYFNRAVLLAKELGIGRIPSTAEMVRMDPQEKRELRSRQRLWLTLFTANTVFHMQFRQPMLISFTDPLISTAHNWLKMADPDMVLLDTQTVFSVSIRRRFLHYRELLKPAESEEVAPPSALSLSILTKTINAEWDVMTDTGVRDIIDAGGTPGQVNKPRLLASSLRLNLNFLILNQTLRIPISDRLGPSLPDPSSNLVHHLASMPAFHHCLNAATSVLMRMQALEKDQLTFAADTLLHFALYAATFLWSLCRAPNTYNFDQQEVAYCRTLILKMAELLDEASAYPTSSAALHAKYLWRLCRDPGAEQERGSSGALARGASATLGSGLGRAEGSGGSGSGMGLAGSATSFGTNRGQLSPSFIDTSGHAQVSESGSGWARHGARSPSTQALEERLDARSNPHGAQDIYGQHSGHEERGNAGDGVADMRIQADAELDLILADFPWTGLDLPWGHLETGEYPHR